MDPHCGGFSEYLNTIDMGDGENNQG